MAAASANKNDRAVAELSKRLQEGWTLLSEVCPVCNTPLVRDREKRIYCVQCELFVMSEEEASKKNLSASAPGTSRSRSNATRHGPAATPTIDEPTMDDLADLPSDFGGYRDMPPLVSSALDNATKQMGDLMLKGWTMMAEHCPACQCPLMQDKSKDGSMLCCGCNQTYVTEDSEAGRKVAREQQRQSQKEEQQKQRQHKHEQKKQLQEIAEEPQEERKQEEKRTRKNAEIAPSLSTGTDSLSSAASALREKIAWAGEQLRLPHSDVQRCRELAKLIHECADALLALQMV